ncbi:hypothetical protein BGZ73_007476 [Actinomortierella ambigua]|nr:hypothetical protein BGZ73_007476 [Actinomortierella ambigua]
MNIFKTVGHLIWRDSRHQELFKIPSGQFYVHKPTAVPGKNAKECIRVYEEGEDENDDTEDDSERLFPINVNMRFSAYADNGPITFRWQGQELTEDADVIYEYVCDEGTSSLACTNLETLIHQCMYEAKYLQSFVEASDAEIKQFKVDAQIGNTPVGKTSTPGSKSTQAKKPSSPRPGPEPAPRPDVAEKPVQYEGIAEAEGELHLYDATTNLFEMQASQVVVQLVRASRFEYWLLVSGQNGEQYLAQPLEERMNPVFTPGHLSFIWNYFDEQSQVYSWLLRFVDIKLLQLFKAHFAECMYEVINRRSWGVSDASDQIYYMKSYDADISMTSAEDEQSESEESDWEGSSGQEEDEEEEEEEEDRRVSFGAHNDKSKNSHLQVGYKDRSFVLRGSKIGVFRHSNADSLEFDTTIDRVVNKAGKEVNPSLMLLHDQDTSMMLLDPKDQDKAYRMDLEYGKIVDEWSLPGTSGVSHLLGDSKYSHLHGTNTMIGMAKDSIFRIDPRLSGNKIVQQEFKQYAKSNHFTAAATTANGSLVIGGDKGEMKLFGTIDRVARTALPGMGNPIIGVDVTGDGRYVLATCKTYLLLIDVLNPANKTLGFDKSFPKDSKPTPTRLQLKPQDVAMMKHEVSFTPAKFNTGENELEKTIVTSTGPYVITWNFRRVKAGHHNEYQIKRYNDDVVADNFKYGHDRSIIVTLPDDAFEEDSRMNAGPHKACKAPKPEKIGEQ